VDVGLMANEAQSLNAQFLHFHTQHSPYTTLKAAMSLDGKIATAAGSSQWITGPKARKYVHELRARSGAVMAGIGTVLADDPQLMARLTPEAPRQPLRIIVDSRLRTPPNCRAIQASSAGAPLLIVTTDRVGIDAAAQIEEREGVKTLRVPADGDRVDLKAMMAALAERQIISVFVEGGGELNAALLTAGVAHSVLFFVAPILIGGRCAPTAIEGDGVRIVSDGVRLGDVKVRRFGQDYAFEGKIDAPGVPNPY
jgi:diaminohydroxyphosphoribosylaminopyrimidine deaminase/5-amino-6-(5-phosphoribosylamino)uracil reductase